MVKERWCIRVKEETWERKRECERVRSNNQDPKPILISFILSL